MIKYWRGKHVILRKEDVIADYMERVRSRPRDKVIITVKFDFTAFQRGSGLPCLSSFITLFVVKSIYMFITPGNLSCSLEMEAIRANSKGETSSWADQEETRREAKGTIRSFSSIILLSSSTSSRLRPRWIVEKGSVDQKPPKKANIKKPILKSPISLRPAI